MRGEHSEIGKTEKSNLELHFDPGTIRGVNEGDTLNIQLGYTVKEHKPKAKGTHAG